MAEAPPKTASLPSTAATSADAAGDLAQGLVGYRGSFPREKRTVEGQRPESQSSDAATRCPAGSDDGEDTSGSGGATSAAAPGGRNRIEDLSSRDGFEESGSSSFGEPGQLSSAQDARRMMKAAEASNASGADVDGSVPAATEGDASPAATSSEKPLPSLRQDGAVANAGSVGHPDECKACAFYCYSLRGCRNGDECTYCHLFHESKLRQRREEWKKTQREKRAKHRDKQSKDEADELTGSGLSAAPEGGPPPTSLAIGFGDGASGIAVGIVAAGEPSAPASSKTSRAVPQQPQQQKPAPAPAMSHDLVAEGAALHTLLMGAQNLNIPGARGPVAKGMPATGVAASAAPPQPAPMPAPETYNLKAAPNPAVVPGTTADPSLHTAAAVAIRAALPAALATAEVFAYTPESIVVGVGQLVELWPPVHLISASLVFVISPDLPHGLALDPRVGLIHGKPQEPTDGMVTYFVTACAPGDPSLKVKMAMVRIKVMDVRVPGHVATGIFQIESGETVVMFKEAPTREADPAELAKCLFRNPPMQWRQQELVLQHLQQQQQQQRQRQEQWQQQLEQKAQQRQHLDSVQQQAHRTPQQETEIREILTKLNYSWEVRQPVAPASSAEQLSYGGVLTF